MHFCESGLVLRGMDVVSHRPVCGSGMKEGGKNQSCKALTILCLYLSIRDSTPQFVGVQLWVANPPKKLSSLSELRIHRTLNKDPPTISIFLSKEANQIHRKKNLPKEMGRSRDDEVENRGR